MRSVLVVEDEAHIRRLMKLKLEEAGYEVELAPDGEAALERLEERSFDALVTDVQMPRMTGPELCERIGERLPERKMLTFVMTSRSEEEFRDWAGARLLTEFIEKPVSMRRLIARLRHHLPQDE